MPLLLDICVCDCGNHRLLEIGDVRGRVVLAGVEVSCQELGGEAVMLLRDEAVVLDRVRRGSVPGASITPRLSGDRDCTGACWHGDRCSSRRFCRREYS